MRFFFEPNGLGLGLLKLVIRDANIIKLVFAFIWSALSNLLHSLSFHLPNAILWTTIEVFVMVVDLLSNDFRRNIPLLRSAQAIDELVISRSSMEENVLTYRAETLYKSQRKYGEDRGLTRRSGQSLQLATVLSVTQHLQKELSKPYARND